MSSPDVSICMVTWNSRDQVDQCLASLYRYSYGVFFEILLVDNASDDGTVELVQSKYREVRVFPQSKNLGFARGNNLALTKATGRYVLFLNPDIVIHSNVLADFRDKMDEDPSLGALGCRLIFPNGETQLTCASNFPNPWNTLCELFLLHRIAKRIPYLSFLSSRSLEHWDHLSGRDIETLSGAFLFCRKAVIDRIGGFDPDYFMYGEDLDLCARIRAAGFRVCYDPTHTVTHYGGASSSRQPSEFSCLWQFRANSRFIDRNLGSLQATFYRFAFVMGMTTRLIMVLLFFPFLKLAGINSTKYLKIYYRVLKTSLIRT